MKKAKPHLALYLKVKLEYTKKTTNQTRFFLVLPFYIPIIIYLKFLLLKLYLGNQCITIKKNVKKNMKNFDINVNVEKVLYSTGYVCRLPVWLLVEQNDHIIYFRTHFFHKDFDANGVISTKKVVIFTC